MKSCPASTSSSVCREPRLALVCMVVAAVAMVGLALHAWRSDPPVVASTAGAVFTGTTDDMQASIVGIGAKLAAVEPLDDVSGLSDYRPPPPPDVAEPPAPVEPATPVAGATEARGTLRLTGIAWMPRDPVAFINGRAVRRQDRLGGLEVVEIGELFVRLRDDDGKVETLRLYEKAHE